jgi:hypothetical protein
MQKRAVTKAHSLEGAMFKHSLACHRILRAALLGLLGVTAGCSSMTAEDFKTIMGGVTQVAQATNEFEATRRAGRAQPANPAGSQTVAQAQTPQFSTYVALPCARLTQRGGGFCMENGCGRMVSVHARSGNGAMGSLVLGPGQCMPIVPGTTAAVACAGSDRFDWSRAACVSS